MENHIKIYLTAFGYDLSDNTQFIPSELSPVQYNDIHHIIGRGKKGEDRIENLMALTRREHIFYGDKVKYMRKLLIAHRNNLIIHKIPFDNEWFEKKLQAYNTTAA